MTCICVSPSIVKAIDDDLDWFPTTRGVGHGAVKKRKDRRGKGRVSNKKGTWEVHSTAVYVSSHAESTGGERRGRGGEGEGEEERGRDGR